MPHNVNALVEKYDAGVGASTLHHGRVWKQLHQNFIVEEMACIWSFAEAGSDATLLWRQFEELIETRGLPDEKSDFRRRRDIFMDIPNRADLAVQRFDNYMVDEAKLENWQKLCRDLSFEVIPPTITQCRRAVQKVYVNIYIFLDGVEAGQPPPPIHRFESLKALAKWPRKKRKLFPKEVAKDEGALRGLLQPLVVGSSKPKKKKKKGKKTGNNRGLEGEMGGLRL